MSIVFNRCPCFLPLVSSLPCVSSKTILNKLFAQSIRASSEASWSKISHAPICTFSVEDLGVPLRKFLRENKGVFDGLPADMYDVRREHIEFLQARQSQSSSNLIDLWRGYFLGNYNFSEIQPLYDVLSKKDREAFDAIKPYRFRAISRFQLVNQNENFSLKRVSVKAFTQSQSSIENKEEDWRKLSRVFSDLQEGHASLPTFRATLLGIAEKVKQVSPSLRKLDIVVHHVKVKTTADRIRGNSPEGIHQDGYPFLVTALVVERKGVSGGESLIFDSDKVSQVFKTTLRPGQGLLQPDLNTKLWHYVTPIEPVKAHQEGIRSIIGFDIDVEM